MLCIDEMYIDGKRDACELDFRVEGGGADLWWDHHHM